MSEIRLWNAYFLSEMDRHDKIDWYLAQVAMAIERSTATKKRKWKIQDYLIKFRKPKTTSAQGADEAKQRVMAWLMGLGAKSKPKDK